MLLWNFMLLGAVFANNVIYYMIFELRIVAPIYENVANKLKYN